MSLIATSKRNSGISILSESFLICKGTKAVRRSYKVTDLFGDMSEPKTCVECGNELLNKRRGAVFCCRNCKDAYYTKERFRFKQEAYKARLEKNHLRAEAWIKEHPDIITWLRDNALADMANRFKPNFRLLWECAKRHFREISFNNNHQKTVREVVQNSDARLVNYFRER